MANYVSWTIKTIHILRIILALASYWKPALVKQYILVQAIFFMIRETLPLDYGTYHHKLVMVAQFLNFGQYAFSFWKSCSITLLSSAYVLFFVRAYVY